MTTAKFQLVTKRFCQRITKMLTAEGITSSFEPCPSITWKTIGQTLIFEIKGEEDLFKVKTVFAAYKEKYDMDRESHFNLECINSATSFCNAIRLVTASGWRLL